MPGEVTYSTDCNVVWKLLRRVLNKSLPFSESTSPLHTDEYKISEFASPMYSTDSEFPSPQLKDVMEQYKNLSPRLKAEKIDQSIPWEDLESLAGNTDDEVIGIITMEDVMEELLQVSIENSTKVCFLFFSSWYIASIYWHRFFWF